jgi:hypothetical protein
MGSGSCVTTSARTLDDEIGGSATLVTGGRLANEKRTNAENLTGIGTVVLMSLHLPHKPAGK